MNGAADNPAPIPCDSLGEAAGTLVGCPFRLHGRDPATGLDCVGLVAASLALVGNRPCTPSGYGLRNLSIAPWISFAGRAGLVADRGPIAGDRVLLVKLGYGQHHLMITIGRHAVVHAHAGLRRVVRQPLPHDITIAAMWRIAPSARG